jgi:RHS repeat-associated protein
MLAAKVIDNPESRHTRFVWEGMRLLQEIGPAPDAEGKIRQNGNERVRSWIYEPDGTGYVPLAAIDQALGKHGVGKAQIHYIHTDHLGTPQEVTDGEGRIEWSADYSAWGERQHSLPLNADEAAQIRTDCAIRFQGQYFDAETGLHYNTFRYYDPGCGRFISPDPINIEGGLNLYQYAPNAANWIDPLGWACGRATKPRASSLSDQAFLRRIAQSAERWGVRKGYGAAGSGHVQGSRKHDYAARVLKRYQKMTGQRKYLEAEQSYLGKNPARHGTPGSARPDVYNRNTGEVFDYKFTKNPSSAISGRQQAHNVLNLPPTVSTQTAIHP